MQAIHAVVLQFSKEAQQPLYMTSTLQPTASSNDCLLKSSNYPLSLAGFLPLLSGATLIAFFSSVSKSLPTQYKGGKEVLTCKSNFIKRNQGKCHNGTEKFLNTLQDLTRWIISMEDAAKEKKNHHQNFGVYLRSYSKTFCFVSSHSELLDKRTVRKWSSCSYGWEIYLQI